MLLKDIYHYCLIKRSGLFDAQYYLLENPDVRQADIDPMWHFIRVGWKEGRNPSKNFNTIFYSAHYPDVQQGQMNPVIHFIKFGKQESRITILESLEPSYNYHDWVSRYDTLNSEDRIKIKAHINKLELKPCISILMPVFNTPEQFLREAIESVLQQLYSFWELCIADDASTNTRTIEILREYESKDPRVKVIYRNENGHISASSNSALAMCTGEFIGLLDHDDILPEHALFWIVHSINKNPSAKLFFSDEDKITETGDRHSPYFKCNYNYDLFLSQNMINHLSVYHSELIDSVGGFREGLDGAQDWDLALRCIEIIKPDQIVHIPRILYHWRCHPNSTAQSHATKPYTVNAGKCAVQDHLKRMKVNAEVLLNNYHTHPRIRYAMPSKKPDVTLIIPTRNGLSYLQRCISSIIDKTNYPKFEIIIVDNNSDDPQTLSYLNSLSEFQYINVLPFHEPFNFSALNNFVATKVKSELIGFVNNDIEVINSKWLEEMASHAIQPGVGAVGARLWYPNDTLQHGGVIIGLGGVAGHSHKHLPKGHKGYFYRAVLQQSFCAVTAACMVIRKSTFIEVGGFDAQHLQIAFNDVDFCLKIMKAGYRNVWTPYAELYHHESVSRGFEDTPEKQARFKSEINYMKQKWGDLLLNDPYYSPNLSLDYEDFRLAFPPRLDEIGAI